MIDTDRAVELYRALGDAVEMSGGSAANTMCGIASFGGRAAYIGKVSGDDLGAVFGHDLHAVGVAFRPGSRRPTVPTGRSIIVVTPDAQRTMNTYLGRLQPVVYVRSRRAGDRRRRGVVHGGLPVRSRRCQGGFPSRRRRRPRRRPAGVAHVVGLVLRRPPSGRFPRPRPRPGRPAVRQSRTNCARCTRSVRSTRRSTSVRRECPLVAVTAGAEGSYVVTPDGTVRVAAEHVDRVLDTTGAGDLYAAGFLLRPDRAVSRCTTAPGSARSPPPR